MCDRSPGFKHRGKKQMGLEKTRSAEVGGLQEKGNLSKDTRG